MGKKFTTKENMLFSTFGLFVCNYQDTIKHKKSTQSDYRFRRSQRQPSQTASSKQKTP